MAKLSFPVTPLQEQLDAGYLLQALRRVAGVTDAGIDLETSWVQLAYDSRRVDTYALVTAVRDVGYAVPVKSCELTIAGMTCSACAFRIEGALADLPGVLTAEVDLRAGTASVEYVGESLQMDAMQRAVEEAGYALRFPAVS